MKTKLTLSQHTNSPETQRDMVDCFHEYKSHEPCGGIDEEFVGISRHVPLSRLQQSGREGEWEESKDERLEVDYCSWKVRAINLILTFDIEGRWNIFSSWAIIWPRGWRGAKKNLSIL